MNKQDDVTVISYLNSNAIDAFKASNEALAELERLIGTYESYGSFNLVKPEFSDKANLNIAYKL